MRRVREIYANEWKQRKLEDPVHYKGLKKDYIGDVSVLVLLCGDARTKEVYLTTRQPSAAAFTHRGIYDAKKQRCNTDIRPWPKN